MDAGCGEGDFLARISGKFPKTELYGCDTNPGAVKIAKESCPKARIDKIDLIDSPSRRMDLVTMLEVIEHQKEPIVLLKKARNMIGRNGHVLISIPRPELLRWRVMWYLWSHTFGRIWLDEHNDHMDETKLLELAEEAGLKLVKKQRFFFNCISIMLFKRV